MDGDRAEAVAGDAVTLTLADEIDISRGDVLCDPHARPDVSDQFAAHLLWMAEEELLPGRQYLLKLGTSTVPATVSPSSIRWMSTRWIIWQQDAPLNEVGYCNFSLSQPLAFDPYRDNRDMGGFILIDRFTNATVGAGMIDFGLRRATNVHWQALDVNKQARARLKGQKAGMLWFTGLSGSGKSTIANLVEKALVAEGRHTYLLDGDNVRHGLNRDLGFTDADRVENIRRVGETAKLFLDAGLIVLVSFISPFRSERRMARELVGEGEFIEVFVDTPLEVCMTRDPKGLYEKARAGAIKNFTGIDSPYEAPEKAEIILATVEAPAEAQAERISQLSAPRPLYLTGWSDAIEFLVPIHEFGHADADRRGGLETQIPPAGLDIGISALHVAGLHRLQLNNCLALQRLFDGGDIVRQFLGFVIAQIVDLVGRGAVGGPVQAPAPRRSTMSSI